MSTIREKLKALHPVWRWLILVSIVAVLFIPGRRGVQWVYHAGAAWRAHQLTREAADLLAHNKPAEAEAKLIAAYNLAPLDLEVLRTGARDELTMKNPRSLAFYRELLKQPASTRADQRDALRACLTFGELKVADGLAAGIIAKNPEAEDYALQAQVRWEEHLATQAIAIMRQALALDPSNREHQILLVRMLILSSHDENQAEAQGILRNLAQTQDKEGLAALEIMSKDQGLDEASRRGIIDQLRKHPLLDDEGRLAAWELEAHLGDRDPKVVMQEVVDFFQSTDLTRKSMAAHWLVSQGAPDLALELAKPPDTTANQDLFLIRLDALANLKNWAEVEKELADPQVPLSQAKIYLYRARAAQELGDLDKSRTNWERARAAADTESGMLAYMGQYALETGMYDEAQRTFSKMAEQSPEQALKGYTALLQAEARAGGTSQLLETLKQMSVDLPDEPEPKNDWAYLSLLLNINVDEALKMGETLVVAHPEMLAYRSTLALAYIRKNNPREAEKVYQGLQIDWSTTPASWRAIYAVVLAANGNVPQAKESISGINRSQLRSEELALLNTYLPEP